MVAVVLGMLVCVGCAVWVVGLVAVPARREGRDVLTERGEQVLDAIVEHVPGRFQEAARGDGRTPVPSQTR
ncbi:MAG TPA: hypothetical protein VFJ97_01905 [Dermatophilaceae bacterium]|nr:hypothetical protein [Dermatophilaceae bacterium]